MKRKSFFKILFIILILSVLFFGYIKKDNISLKEENIQDILEMNASELKILNGKGKEIRDDNDKIKSITYEGRLFGIDKVKYTYHFFEDRDKISGVKIYFPEKTDINIVIENISDQIGQPTFEKINKEYREHYIEWQTDNKVYYTLNNYKKVEKGQLLELTIVVLP